jgi:uncharacterized membrane protein
MNKRQLLALALALTATATAFGQVPITQPPVANPLDVPPNEQWRVKDVITGEFINTYVAYRSETDAAGNIWVLEFSQNNARVRKWSPQGTLFWTTADGFIPIRKPNSDTPNNSFLRVDSLGNCIVAGSSAPVGGPSFKNVFRAIKFRGDGTRVWDQSYDEYPLETYINTPLGSMSLDSAGNVLMAGTVLPVGRILVVKLGTDDGSVLWSARYGLVSSSTPGASDHRYSKLTHMGVDASGTARVAVQHSYKVLKPGAINEYQVVSRYGITIAAFSASGATGAVVEYDPLGGQTVENVAVTPEGRMLLQATLTAPAADDADERTDFPRRHRLVSLSPSLTVQWIRDVAGVFGGLGYDYRWSDQGLIVDPDGNTYTAYLEPSIVPFQGGTTDAMTPVIWKHDAAGILLWERRMETQVNHLDSGYYFNYSPLLLTNGNLLVSTPIKGYLALLKARLTSLSLTTGTDVWNKEMAVTGEHLLVKKLLPSPDGFFMQGDTFNNPPSLVLARFRPGGRANTLSPMNVQSTTATLRGAVNPMGAATMAGFEYGTTTSYGSTAPLTPQNVGSGIEFMLATASITGLTPSTTYHYRVNGTTAQGSFYGQDMSFETNPPAAPPLPADDAFVVQKNVALHLQATDLLANDLAGSSSLPFTILNIGNQVNCSASLSGGLLNIQPALDFIGTASFTYTVANAQGGTATATVVVQVKAPSVQPTISGLANVTLFKSGVSPWLDYTVGPPANAASIAVTASSINPALLPPSRIDFAGTGAARQMRLRPVCGATGQAVITLTATSLDNLTATTSFTVNVVERPPVDAAEITGLGFLASFGGVDESSGQLISADGNVVAGTSLTKAFRWTAAGGMQDIHNGTFPLKLSAISSDGDIIAGYKSPGEPAPYLWTSNFNYFQALPDIFQLNGLSGDGSVAVGHLNDPNPPTFSDVPYQPVRWTAAGGIQNLEKDGATEISATGISSDGAIIVGWRGGFFQKTALVWLDPFSSPVNLVALPGGLTAAATAVSADGSVIVGYSDAIAHPGIHTAVRWVREGFTNNYSVHALDSVAPTTHTEARGVSADGSRIVGTIGSGFFSVAAIVWDAENGQQLLQTALAHGGANVNANWSSLNEANSISADGLYIVGTGTRSSFQKEAFRVRLPLLPPTPLISAIADVITPRGTTTAPISFTLTDADSNTDCLDISFAVSNPTLVPLPNIVINGTGANRTITITPVAGLSGKVMVVLTVSDGFSSSDEEFILTVNSPPAALAQTVSTNEDNALIITPTGTDVENEPLTFSIVTQPDVAKGTVSEVNNQLHFVPVENANGAATFTFRAHDGTSFSAPATITVNITPVNDEPVAQDASFTVVEDTALANRQLNGSDVESTDLQFLPDTQPAHGILSLFASGLFTYTPAANYSGADSFTYIILDEASAVSNIATVTLTVTPVNDPPVALSGSFTTPENTPYTGALQGSDPDGDPLTFRFFFINQAGEVGRPKHGAITMNTATGAFTYTPHANYHGPDEILFQVREPGGSFTNVATVAITVTSVDDGPPLANNAIFSGIQDTFIPGFLSATDPDGDAMTFVQDSQPAHGTALLFANGEVLYTPAPGFHGVDTFTYHVTAGGGTSNLATIRVRVRSATGRVLLAENANGFIPSSMSQGIVSMDVSVSYVAAVTSTGGVVTERLKDSYPSPPPVPLAAQSGVTAVAAGSATYFSTAPHFLAIKGGSVIAWGNNTQQQCTVPADASDGTVIRIAAGSGVSAALRADGRVVGWGDKNNTQNGIISTPPIATANVTAIACGLYTEISAVTSSGSLVSWNLSDQVQVTANAFPTAVSTVAKLRDCDTFFGAVYTNGTVAVLGNMKTYDINTGAFLGVNTPAVIPLQASFDVLDIKGGYTSASVLKRDGSLVSWINTNGGIPTIRSNLTPSLAQGNTLAVGGGVGSASFFASPTDTYKTCYLIHEDDAPSALPQTISLAKNSSKVITPAGADTTNDALTFALASQPAHGTAVANANGTFTYTPEANYTGADSFTFTASDGTSTSTPGTLTLSVLDTDPFSAWRLTNFGSANNLGYAADLSDTDRDGRTNLEEFAFGTDPRLSEGGAVSYAGGVLTKRGAPTPVITGPPGNQQTLAVFCRRADWQAAGLTYTVLFSANLSNKVPSATIPTVLATDGEIEVVAIPYPAHITVGGQPVVPQFFQVQITKNP